jgi:hypothetical protein
MNANEILPAIPRQKVKNKDGRIGGVLCWHDGDIYPNFIVVLLEDGTQEDWHDDECEPVHEEPRPFRVGDKVKCLNTSVFSTIKNVRIAENGWPEQYVVDEFWQTKENMRHATPQEVKDYFN